jgi:hypothetical protein
MKGNPTATVIPRVDESKSTLETIEDFTEPKSVTRAFPALSIIGPSRDESLHWT